MSLIKSQKAELIAIYRLEFYKKQNNWKLSSSRKAKKSSQKTAEIKKNLNVTYNVDSPESEEQSDPLNIAFVDTDSDKTTKTKSVKFKPDIKKELSQEWQESINIWPKTESWEPSSTKEHKADVTLDRHDYCEKLSNNQPKAPLATPKSNTLKRLEELQKAAILHLREQPNFIEECPKSLELKDAWVERDVGDEDFGWDGQCSQDNPVEADVLNVAHAGSDIWAQVPQVDAIDGFYYPEDINSEDWQHHAQFGDTPWNEAESANHLQEAEECSVDSEGEFLRGAHAAPHSSETELALPPELTTPDVSFSSLCRLSTSQLLQAARQHSLVLRRLLLESEYRQKLRTAMSLNSFSGSSFEEFPTRDVGPYLGSSSSLNRTALCRDVFITGSHRNVGVVRGRGRGRLVDNPLWG